MQTTESLTRNIKYHVAESLKRKIKLLIQKIEPIMRKIEFEIQEAELAM